MYRPGLAEEPQLIFETAGLPRIGRNDQQGRRRAACGFGEPERSRGAVELAPANLHLRFAGQEEVRRAGTSGSDIGLDRCNATANSNARADARVRPRRRGRVAGEAGVAQQQRMRADAWRTCKQRPAHAGLSSARLRRTACDWDQPLTTVCRTMLCLEEDDEAGILPAGDRRAGRPRVRDWRVRQTWPRPSPSTCRGSGLRSLRQRRASAIRQRGRSATAARAASAETIQGAERMGDPPDNNCPTV